MMTMTLRMTGGTVLLLVLTAADLRADEAEEKAVQAVEKLGGYVRREKADVKPVVAVHLIGERVTDAGLKEVAALKQLQTLILINTPVTDAGLKELAALKQLQSLELAGTQVTDAGLKELAALKQLQSLKLCGEQFSDAGVKELAALKQLQSLNLRTDHVTDAGLKELTALKQLQSLNLWCPQVTDVGLKELAALKQLQSLDLGEMRVTDAGLKELATLKQLRSLNLRSTPVTDAGLKELAALEQLQSLSLWHTQVTDAGLKEVAALKQLQSLDLSYTQVTDAGLKELAALKQLQKVDLYVTEVTDEGVAELRKALPKVTIGYRIEPPGRSPASGLGDCHIRTLVRGNNQFALELYAKLREKDGNLFFSPYSISTALGMTYAGARGNTAKQMAATLHFTQSQDTLHTVFGLLIKQINGDGKPRGYELYTANALWLQSDYHFLPGFLKLTRPNYGAELREVDFKGASEATRQTINAWVEKQTKDRIKELLKAGILDEQTRLVLTNAIYFKGNWASQFKKEATRDEPFLVAADKKVNVPMMHQKADCKYFDTAKLQLLEMPYEGKDLSMVVLLPKEADGLADLEKSLTMNLQNWLVRLHKSDVEVALPKFQATSEFRLDKALIDMGMKDAFDIGTADFSGMTGSRDLYIKAVVHKAFVDVNEEGTEAAAATAVVENKNSPRVTPSFRADHPFLFLIRDTRYGSILFLGRVTNPVP